MDFIRKEIDEEILKILLEKVSKEELYIEKIIKLTLEEFNIDYDNLKNKNIIRRVLFGKGSLDLNHKDDKNIATEKGDKMTAKEIMESLQQGKKMRQKDWNRCSYIKLDEKGNIVDCYGEIYTSITINVNTVWEEYVEIVSFSKVVDHILNGGSAHRIDIYNRRRDVYLDETNSLTCIIYPKKNDRKRYINLEAEDLEATNWVLN